MENNINKQTNTISMKTKMLSLIFILFLSILSVNAVNQEKFLEWQFEEASGSIVFDSSGNNNNGIVTGAIWDSIIKKNGAYSIFFDGNNDLITSINTFETDNVTTLSFWFYMTDDANNRYFFDIDDTNEEYELEFEKTPKHLFIGYINNTGGYTHQQVTTSVIVKNVWTHIIISYDNQNDRIILRRNGNLETNVSVTGGLNKEISLKNFKLGTNHQSTLFFKGNIDSLFMLNFVPNLSQVNELFTQNKITIPQINGNGEDNDTQIIQDIIERNFITDYYPKITDNVTQNGIFELLLNHTATCELYLNNKIINIQSNINAFSFEKTLEIGEEYTYFFYCYYYFNNYKYVDTTPYITFITQPPEPQKVYFQFIGTDFNVNDLDLYLVTPCMEKGFSSVGGKEFLPYRSEYNKGGITFAKVENGLADIFVEQEINEFCLFNGKVIVNEEGKTSNYDIVSVNRQIPLGEIKTPNNVTSLYKVYLEQFDMYGKTNPKAWGMTWATIISGLLLFVLGLIITFAGVKTDNGKIVFVGAMLCLSAFGISVTGFVGLLF